MAMKPKKITIQDLQTKKDRGEKIVRVTCYDYPMALLADRAGVDSVLVGDSLGMVVLGRENTVAVTMEEMIHHCKAVTRAVRHALVIGDLPFLSYQTSVQDAIRNAGRLLKEGNVDAVKLEGGKEFASTVRALFEAGIPVVGHIGLTPQTVSKLGGFKVQGKDADSAKKILADAVSLEQAGAFMLTIECVPDRLAKLICERLIIPATGIGSGPYTDGQSLSLYDMVGLFDRFTPKFVKQYADVSEIILHALEEFSREVRKGSFPTQDHCFTLNDEVLKKVLDDVG
jgi:3-methyl-2-oxobutanoate hydroxymethyltransferase